MWVVLLSLDGLPAEGHPQLLAAEGVCGRIAAQCGNHKPDQANQRVQELFSHYRECVGEGDLEEAMDCAEEMAALALVVVFIGAKIFLVGIIGKIPPVISLSVTLGLLIGGVLLSLYKTRNQAPLLDEQAAK